MWAEQLLCMYNKWAEKHGYRGMVVEKCCLKTGGFKSATVEFEYRYIYGYLFGERGVHSMISHQNGSPAHELFAYDTVNKCLSPNPEEQAKLPIPPSLVAGAFAGVSSTLVTYPLELLKTRLTIQRGVYEGLFDAFVKILQEGGVPELYRGRQIYANVLHALSSILENEGLPGLYSGLGPSCMKLVPAARISFMCYEACKRILMEKEDEA